MDLQKIIYIIKHTNEKNIWIDKSLHTLIFSPENLEIDQFIRNDDITFFYHLMKWKEDSYEPLSKLCTMFINRDLLKASDISFLNKIDRLEVLAFEKAM